jgi:uncharacterized protein YgiM (DUF1202 family)
VKSYVWLSFAFMGWAYYEMSGGSDFVPDQPAPQLLANAEADSDKTVAVTRADTTALLAVSASNVVPVSAQAPVEVIVELDITEPETLDIAAPPEPEVDLRAVAGSRVNMRMGPGTTFDVITTLTGGTELEVIDITAEGWANVRTMDLGIEGWMAERLLTDPQT